MLVQHYVRRFSHELGREVREVAPEALERLRSYSWPGNVRELQSVLKQALLQARGTTLLPTFLPALPAEPSGPVTASPGAIGDLNLEAFIRLGLTSGERNLYAETHRQVDRLLLTRVLEHTGGNQLRAARRLGIGRETLSRRLRELGLHISRRLQAEEE
jgi:two-component system nitrogen regulation response regulator GlnG